jgi:DNA-binding transcriptional LysR family regulator
MKDKKAIENIDVIKNFDLNLFVVFETVYAYRSGAKAAQVLNVSPSAISQSLNKLRLFYSDVLFVREGAQGVSPTTTAVNLHAQISVGIGDLASSLGGGGDNQNAKKFILYSSPYAALRVIPNLMNLVQKSNQNFEITHISSDNLTTSVEDILAYRKADVIFDTNPHFSFSTVTHPYLQDYAVPVCRKDHPRLGNTLSRAEAEYEQSTYLDVSSDMVNQTQSQIQEYFGDRKFFFSSSSIIATIAVIEKTDCIGFIPEWFARKASSSFNIRILESDFNPEPVNTYMIYNKSSLRNKSSAFIINFFEEARTMI